MSKFQERFKNKSSTVSTSGVILIDPNRAIIKPQETQMHSSVIKSSATYILNSGSPPPQNNYFMHNSKLSINSNPSDIEVRSSILPKHSESPKFIKKGQNSSATPIVSKPTVLSNSQLKELNKSYEKKVIEFTPYTIKDYYVIKPKTYYQLGGLGPASVGTNEWLQKKELNEKRLRYGRNIYYLNAAKLPLLPIISQANGKIRQQNSRDRALNFAKTIQKPPLRLSLSPN